MHINFGSVLTIATRALGAIITGVPAVQAFKQTAGAADSAQLKDSILLLVQSELAAARIATGHDLAADADVLGAAGSVIDAVAAFHAIVAHKAAAPAPTT